jgi:hypothetical protein
MHQIHRRGGKDNVDQKADAPHRTTELLVRCTGRRQSSPCFWRWISSIMMSSGPRAKASRSPGIAISAMVFLFRRWLILLAALAIAKIVSIGWPVRGP